MSCGVGHRHGQDLAWLWCRPVATAPIWPLTWKSSYAKGAALKKQKRQKKKKRKMDKRLGQRVHNKCQQCMLSTYNKVLNIINNQRNTNLSTSLSLIDHHVNLKVMFYHLFSTMSKESNYQNPSGGNVNWHNYFGKQFGITFYNLRYLEFPLW